MKSARGLAGVMLVFLLCAASARAEGAAHTAPVPVVLVPGFMGQRGAGVMAHYWAPSIIDALEGAGVDVTELCPPPLASSEVRAQALLRQIDAVRARTRAPKVIVIAHSQGGIDMRALLAQGGGDRIAAIASIASPHHGTGVADTALGWPMPLVRATLDALAVSEDVAQGESPRAADADGALANLSRAGMTRFSSWASSSSLAAAAPVPYFSIASYTGRDVDGSCRGGAWDTPDVVDPMNPLLVFGHAMISASWGDVTQDGVVPTSSMRWGRFLGCVAADHLDWEGFIDVRAPTDVAAFTLELYRALDDVAHTDASAMDAHLPRLARLAHARPVP